MTASALLERMQSILDGIAGWTVLDYLRDEPADKQIDIRLSGGTVGGFTMGGNQVMESVVVRATTTLATDTPKASYHALLNVRDSIVAAVMAEKTALANEGVLLWPQQIAPTFEEVGIAVSSRNAMFWETEVRFPVERRF